MASPHSPPPELTPEPDLDYSGRGKLLLCSSGVEGKGDAAIIVNSLKINYKPVTLNTFTSTSLPGSLDGIPPVKIQFPLTQVPSQVTLDAHLPAPPAPSHAEAQARAPSTQHFGLTTTLVPASPIRVRPLQVITPPFNLPYAGSPATSLGTTNPAHSRISPPTRSFLNPRAKPWAHQTALPHTPLVPPTKQPHQPPHVDPLVSAARAMGNRFNTGQHTNDIITSIQQPMVTAPTSTFHPAAELLDTYSKHGFPASVGEQWPMTSILAAIDTGPHASTLTPDSVNFVREELLERTKRGFSIILTMDEALKHFGSRLRISRLASVDQANRKPRLICNSTAAPDSVTPSVNASSDTSLNPNAIQFGSCLARLLQKVWEANPADGPVYLSKWDISDAFHRCNLRPSDVGSFAYVVPALSSDPAVLLCIDLVLPMGWINSPDLFCSTSETVADVANQLINQPDAPVPSYGPTRALYHTVSSPTASPSRLQYADVYVDDINCVTQGDALQQQRVSELVLKALKDIYPHVPGETKDSVSLKKALAGDGDWNQVKEILGWIVDTRLGTLRLSQKRVSDLLHQLNIAPSRRKIRRKQLEILIGKLRSMHLAIPGAIGHFYYLQQALTKATPKLAYMSNGFHKEIKYWQELVKNMDTRPTYLAEIVQRHASALGFTDASGKGAGGVWLDPNADGHNFVWRFEWPEDIRRDLVSWSNPGGRITNSDLELAALILQESVFPLVCSKWHWHAPITGSDSTPTVSWSFKEASTINPVVADLLRIRSIINRNACITPSVCFHPGVDNTMADDASRRFDLPTHSFMSFFDRKYTHTQSPCSWTLCHPPTEVLSSVISALRKQQFAEVTYHPPAPTRSTPNGSHSAPTSKWTTACKTICSRPSKSFKCMDTGFITATTLANLVSGQTRLQRRGALLPRPTFWKASKTPENHEVQLRRTSTSA